MVYRTTALTPLFSLRREMDRLFDDTFGRAATNSTSWTPAVDVREEKDAFVFQLELPGVSPEAVEVTADGGVLSVSGEKKSEEQRDEDRWHIVERVSGSFRRTFQLPQNVTEEKIDATFEDGVLTVRVPKAEQPKPKKIEVRKAVHA
ncbi:MAG TPA: Hsp20/alpha crystallin family protein [Gemmatimonadaceae bacterium]|nr:Hsp20/alpha crystallin family protein [Gemmatimonadaceae bacterium]